VKIEPTAGEIRAIIKWRKIAEVDKKLARFIIPCFIVFLPTLILLVVALGAFSTERGTITYDLGNDQILTTESAWPIELNGTELKPVDELPDSPAGLTAVGIALLVMVSLFGTATFSLIGYEHYAGWKAQATLLESYLEADGKAA